MMICNRPLDHYFSTPHPLDHYFSMQQATSDSCLSNSNHFCHALMWSASVGDVKSHLFFLLLLIMMTFVIHDLPNGVA
jgi:hypothetical protein